MKIQKFFSKPITEIPFLNAGKGQGSFYTDHVPVHIALVDKMPMELDAIIATADLQGRETFEQATKRFKHVPSKELSALKLLGEVIPKRLSDSVLPDLGIQSDRCGCLLAGDFYTVPNLDKRGGSGDVLPVWQEFQSHFRWVIGVAGNHDAFESQGIGHRKSSRPSGLLDETTKQKHGLKIAGLSGIVGNPKRKWRKWSDDYYFQWDELLDRQPDIIVSHDGPSGIRPGQRGEDNCLRILENKRPTLAIRGHAHWKEPFCELSSGSQILNVDCRIVILQQRQ